MQEIVLLCIACFAIAYIAIRKVSAHHMKIGITGIDINKKHRPALPESTGISLLVPLWFATIAIFIATRNLALIAWAVMVSGFSIVGFADDSRHRFGRSLPWKIRACLIAFISLLYASVFFHDNLVLVFLAALYLAGVASFENTFAGLNGLEIGSGFLISIFIALVLINTEVFALAAALSASIFALLLLNRYPAKVFPGDSGTLLIGSAMAGLIITQGSLRLMVLTFMFFVPHIIDFLLKIMTNPHDPSQKKELPYVLNSEGKLEIPKSGKLDFAKMLILFFGPKSERTIVPMMWLIVVLNCSFWYILWLSIFK